MSNSANDVEARERLTALRRRYRPDNEVPVSVAVDVVLGETPDFVVYLSGVRVFRTVLEFQVTALARHSGTGRDLGRGLFGHGAQEDRLLIGVEYADGRTGSNVGRGGDEELRPTTPVLLPGGGGGGDRSADTRYYLSPLPPPGPLRIIAAWPGRGLAETVTEIAADPFVEAAEHVRILWDLEPDEPPARPQLPPLPPDSWFARSQA